jgi:hypothetical protein
MNPFNSRRPSIVSVDGYPSFSPNSETCVRFFIGAFNLQIQAARQVESMPRNNSTGKVNRRAPQPFQ